MNKAIFLISLLLSTLSYAKPNLPPPVEDFVKLEKLAGRAGAFTTKENFPKDYFLIPKNLPYLVGLSLYDPSSSNLNLTKEQIEKILLIKENLTKNATPIALKVKELELELMQKVALDENIPVAKEYYKNLEEIAKLRVELSKIHLDCIEQVRKVLTKKQYEELLDYGIVNMF